MDYAIIDQTGLVVNVTIWDGTSSWAPPKGCTAVPLEDGGIGWSYVDGKFVEPMTPDVESGEDSTAS